MISLALLVSPNRTEDHFRSSDVQSNEQQDFAPPFDPEHQQTTTTGAGSKAAADESVHLGKDRRRFLIAVVLLLVVFPAARWTLSRGVSIPRTTAADRAQLQTSFELIQAGRYEEAVSIANAIIAVDPNSADAYNNLAVSYMGLHRVDDALEAVEQALRLRPDDELATNNLNWFQQEKATIVEQQGKPSAEIRHDK